MTRYQVMAAAAVAVLWRDYRQQPRTAREDRQRRELAEGCGRQDYLCRRWERLL
jgi:hypothetical protein